MVEPELPQSRGSLAGVTRPPTPVISTVAVCVSRDLRAQSLHAGERGCAIGAGGEVGEARCAFGKCCQHAVAMADGFVAGKAQAAEDVACGANDAFFGGGMQEDSGNGDRLSLTSGDIDVELLQGSILFG